MSLRLGTGIGPLGSAGIVALWNAQGIIESIQRGAISPSGSNLSATATITAVDTSRSIVQGLGGNNSGVDNWGLRPSVALTNSTTVTATRNGQDGTQSGTIYYEVIQFYPGIIKSLQDITMNFNGPGQPTNTITAVTMNKTQLFRRGFRFDNNYSGTTSYVPDPGIQLSSTTTVGGSAGALGGGHTYYVTVMEVF